MVRLTLTLSLVVLAAGCVKGNVCERRLIYEEEECFPELEQPTDVDKEDCDGDEKAFSKCAVRNEEAYCEYYQWKNRGAVRREGYTVSDFLNPSNEFLACLDEEGLREK